jgi:hypothetical protein
MRDIADRSRSVTDGILRLAGATETPQQVTIDLVTARAR